MKEDVSYYEKDFAYMKSRYSQGHYSDRNLEAASRLLKYHPKYVLEIAGAEGHLAKCILKDKGVKLYHFTDFAPTALELAQKQNEGDPRITVSLFDAEKDWNLYDYTPYDTFVCTASEHFTTDLKIISKLKRGTVVFLSLPNFQCKGHVRSFRSMEQVVDRYDNFLAINEYWMSENSKQFKLSYKLRDWMLRHKTELTRFTDFTGVEIIGNKVKYNIIAYKK